MNLANAELVKLANNTFVTTKISFGNMLSQICERLPDAHVDVVTSALGLDSRIGSKYLKGGVGYGGPCYPRDNIALSALAKQIGAEAPLPEATDKANRKEVARLRGLIKAKAPSGGTVGVLGLAYKPDTDVVEESQGLLLAQALVAEGIPVVAYDPAAMDAARQVLGDSVRLADSLKTCIQQADVVVITVPWRQFSAIEPEQFLERGPRVLIDCWRMLDAERFALVTEYVPLGVGPRSQDSANS
jgi:UDPglucose 6-dehydrogenase